MRIHVRGHGWPWRRRIIVSFFLAQGDRITEWVLQKKGGVLHRYVFYLLSIFRCVQQVLVKYLSQIVTKLPVVLRVEVVDGVLCFEIGHEPGLNGVGPIFFLPVVVDRVQEFVREYVHVTGIILPEDVSDGLVQVLPITF